MRSDDCDKDDESKLCEYAIAAAKPIQFLHSKSVIHRDIAGFHIFGLISFLLKLLFFSPKKITNSSQLFNYWRLSDKIEWFWNEQNKCKYLLFIFECSNSSSLVNRISWKIHSLKKKINKTQKKKLTSTSGQHQKYLQDKSKTPTTTKIKKKKTSKSKKNNENKIKKQKK